MLRRVTPPRGPKSGARQEADAAPAPETTQVLRRVNAPRSGEPDTTARPTVPRPAGEDRAAQTSGAGPAGAAAPSSPAAARA
ncbi:hypothetical protein AB0B37_34690, partial [Streptomyces olivaceoviridis]